MAPAVPGQGTAEFFGSCLEGRKPVRRPERELKLQRGFYFAGGKSAAEQAAPEAGSRPLGFM